MKNIESEKTIEAHLREGVQKRGGIALKLTSQFHRGMPDRLVLLPYKTICFVELKSTDQKPERLQQIAMLKLAGLGFRAFVIDSEAELEEFFRKMDARMARIEKELTDEV